MALLLLGLLGLAQPGIRWESWSATLFERAQREHKLVVLDLGAVWCHWCHVMEETSYRDPQVVKLIGERYLAVKADQDADPELSRRYEDWGWPATIVFAPDGRELAKRKGYLPPEALLTMLQAFADDPSPGPSVRPELAWPLAKEPRLTATARAALEGTFVELYDREHAGWGQHHKFLDAEPLEYALSQPRYRPWARRTLDQGLLLIDPVWGGIYQYSDQVDWKSPHYEKLMSSQAQAIELYVQAYRRWHDPKHLAAARSIARYVTTFLRSPEGAFYVSQDADLDEKTPGKVFYAADDAGRRKLGLPRIDTHLYPRENGWAATALARLHAAAPNPQLFEAARAAVAWAEAHRRLPDGTFTHGEADRGGPFLGDSLAMAEAYAALAEADPRGPWAERAVATLRAIDARFRDREAGYVTAPATGGPLARPFRLVDENVALARLAAALTPRAPALRAVRDHAMRYLASPALLDARPFSPTVLLVP